MSTILGSDTNSPRIDSGTLALINTPTPQHFNGFGLSIQDKIAESLRRSLPLLPAEARHQVELLLSPQSLAIVAGTLMVWAGSHFFGVGEIVDVILLITGFALLGWSVFSGGEELYLFATTAVNARTDADLQKAARHFASAVSILGIAAISAVLLRRSGKVVVERGTPNVEGLPDIGPPPPLGTKPSITRPFSLPGGALGETDWWGNIAVTRNQSLTEQRLTLYHEWVHSVLSPRLGPFRRLRAQLRISAYWRSALLRALEEAMAETYAQLKVNGLENVIVGMRFPIDGGYVTVSQLANEGSAIGSIVVGGQQLTVSVQVDK